MDEDQNEVLALEGGEMEEVEDNATEERQEGAGGYQYEISLSSLHQYLGATEELSGRTIIAENDCITIPILLPTASIDVVLLPSQTLPLTIVQPMVQSMLRKAMSKDKIFGIIHTSLSSGTIAEIFEYHDDENSGTLSIKAKGRQRFKVLQLHREVTGCIVANVQILPDIIMPDPLRHIRPKTHQVLNLSKPSEEAGQKLVLRNKASLRSARSWSARRSCSVLTPWPSWVYDMYDDHQLALKLTNEIVQSFKDQTNIEIPRDPDELSHWASINLPLSDENRINLLSLDSSTQRLRFILSLTSQILKKRQLNCGFCRKMMAQTRDIFSMSTDGPQGTFVNPDGYVHEMITVTKAVGLRMTGEASTRYSWFPGYSWQIACCKHCDCHMGWLFKAAKKRLQPSSFFGLTRKSVTTSRAVPPNQENPLRYII